MEDSAASALSDSSVLHISDILNKENISIFGPTNFKKNKPYSTKSKTLYKNYFCSPCVGWSENYRRNIDEVEALQICKYNHKCMKDISPEDILNIIFEIN